MNLRFVFSLIVSLLSLLPAAAQDLTRNWIRERIFLDAEGKKCVTSVQYFDGIGRETLLLTDGLSPGGDVAGALTGESFAGRTSAKWLPATGLTGFDFLTPERVKSLAVSSHEGDSVPFSLTRRDALGRVSSVRNAGGDLAGKAQLSDYTVNRTSAPVKRYCVDASGKLASRGMWREGALRGVLTSDEDGISTEVFSDLRGRKVLERRNGNNDTYFVYDDAGRLSFVLTPGMQEDSNLLKHAYEYRYDRRSECVYSRIPGCEPVEMHRDTAGRTAVVRDGVLRKKGRSRFILYDRLGSVRSVADEDGNVLQQNLYYARGGAWGDVCTAPGFQSYKYCGKYLDRKHGLDLYDYGARLYDPAAAFWTSPDPLCEKYYNISPYAFCNDNPVTFIDPDGRKWKTLEDKEKATRIQEISMFHVRSLEKAIQKIKRKIEVANNDISLSEKARNRKIKRYKENLSELQYKKNLLSHLHDGISILENSSQTYAYKRIYNGIASIVWDGNTIYIENFGTIGSYAHETVHAIQRERGFIIFKEGKAFANMLELFEIEKEAYQTEYSITNGLIPYSETSTPTNIFGITPKWFRGLKFNGTDVY